MFEFKRIPRLVLAVGQVMVFVAPVAAGQVQVENPSFELPAMNPCGFAEPIATGWINGGVWHPAECHNAYPDGVPDGQQIGYTSGEAITQALDEELTSFTRVVLTVAVGRRLDGFTDGTYRVQLYAGGALLAEDNSTQSPPPGGFITSTVLYDALPGDPMIGEPLEIRLARVTGTQANFDDVHLDTFDIDCNNNGIVDEIDIGNGLLRDADRDGIADGCDVAEGTPGDVTGDGIVGPADLAQLLASWGPCPACDADFNNDGTVGPPDLGQLLANWG